MNMNSSDEAKAANLYLNPVTPFIGKIAGGLRVGTKIIVEGHVLTWRSHQFNINLLVGHDQLHNHVRQADVALHFNPRFDDGYLLLNSRTGGRWKAEQQESLTILKGQDFKLVITVEEASYRITVNRHHLANFTHRIACEEVGLLLLEGQVKLRRIEFV